MDEHDSNDFGHRPGGADSEQEPRSKRTGARLARRAQIVPWASGEQPLKFQTERNTTLIWSLPVKGHGLNCLGQWHGVMRHKSAAATMDQTDIRGLVTTVHRSVMEAASL